MKYLKLLLIAVFASAILVSCYKDDVFEGKGDAVVQFDPDNDGENDVYFRTVNELPFNPSAAEITGALVSLPITYVGEPSTFPFSVEYDVEVVSGEGASYEDVAWQTSPNNIIYFGEGITEDEEGAPIPMTATSYIEFLPAPRPESFENVTLTFTLKNPTNEAKLGDNTSFTVIIENIN